MSKKKIILKVVLVFVALIVVWRVNAMINTKHAVVPDGKAGMMHSLKKAKEEKDKNIDELRSKAPSYQEKTMEIVQ